MDNITKYVKGVMITDGDHEYAIPEGLYNEHQEFIDRNDVDSEEWCDKFNDLFGVYRIDGNFEFYIKLKD